MPLPHRKARASTTRRPAAARRSCSSTSSAATIAAGTTRCATSAAAGAASRWGARGYPRSDAPDDREALRPGLLQPRCDRGARRGRHRQGPYRRPEHGRLHGADAGGQISRAGHLLHGCGRRLGRAEVNAGAVHRGSAAVRAAEFERAGQIDAEAMGLSPTRVQLQIKDPIGWQHVRAHIWPSIPLTRPPGHCARCRRGAPRSTTWRAS